MKSVFSLSSLRSFPDPLVSRCHTWYTGITMIPILICAAVLGILLFLIIWGSLHMFIPFKVIIAFIPSAFLCVAAFYGILWLTQYIFGVGAEIYRRSRKEQPKS